jgi:DNA-binding MarR family transcriptional regulator
MSFQPLGEFYKEVLERHKRVSEGKSEKVGESKYYLKITRKYLKNHLRDLSPSEKIVMIALDLHRNKETNTAWPRHKTLIELTGLSLTSLKRTLKSLEKKGKFEISRKEGTSNVYVFKN